MSKSDNSDILDTDLYGLSPEALTNVLQILQWLSELDNNSQKKPKDNSDGK